MTPQAMAQLHARAFAPERGWQASEFANLIASKFVTAFVKPHGFALTRQIADEAELLTLAVDPEHHRKGIASDLMRDWLVSLGEGTAFLEVAADNGPAQALYAKHGFAPVGRRKAYYARPGAPSVDAVLMQLAVTRRQTG